MKIVRDNGGVSEIIGTILLLAIAVAALSVVYINVLSDDGPSPDTIVSIVGKMESGDVVFDHRSGEEIGIDSEVRFTIAGSNQEFWSIENLLNYASQQDSVWNIGEQLIYHPSQNLTGVKIEASVIDKDSNQMVFWGILQEGYTIPPFGRGGIWHFDEPWWNGTTDEVEDSSGNENHGISTNGANISDDAVSLRAGHFDGINDYVEVDNHYSLNLREAITIEAWIKPLELNHKLDELTLDQKFGYTPYIIHVSGNMYAIVSEFQQKGAMLSIVNITNDGEIEERNIEFKFGESTGSILLRPVIIKLADDLFVVSYNEGLGNPVLHLKSFNIYSDGTISYTGNELIFSDSDSKPKNRASMIKIKDNIFAITYRGTNDVGVIKTIVISSAGDFLSIEDNFVFDLNSCFEPYIINLSNGVYAISYRGPSNNGIIKTFYISETGEITYTVNEYIFDFNDCFEPNMITISPGNCAIFYRGDSDDGTVKTFNITVDGSINYFNQNFIFDDEKCFDPWVFHHSDDLYIITYSTGSSGASDGFFCGLEILLDGLIEDIIIPRLIFESSVCHNPISVKISDRILAVTYEGQVAHPGELITLLIEDDQTPAWERGIVKGGSASIYANMTHVVGSINGEDYVLTLPVNPNQWNHVVLTFDGSMIRFYCNYDSADAVNNPNKYAEEVFTGRINENPEKLLFGYLFSGLIDEIGIFDHAITQDEIFYHQTCIGCYEV